jgi:hypothetical protein
MSVTPNNIITYGSADMPEADGATVGGACDFTKRVSFYDISPAGALDVVSSSASDTATKIQVMGRDSTGTSQTPAAITLTGTTVIANAFGGQSFERLLAGVITGGAVAGLANPGGTAAVGDVAVLAHTRTITAHTAQLGSANTSGSTPPVMKLQAGDGATIGALTFGGLGLVIRITGGTGVGQLRMITAQYSATGAYGGAAFGADFVAINRDWSTIPDGTSTYDIAPGLLFDISPNPVTAIVRMFATATADVPGGSTRTFYEKVFAVNTNTVTALQSATLQIASNSPALPAGAALDLALCKALNDTATVANRQTLPANGDTTALSFVAQPSAINVIASPGSLPVSAGAGNASNAQGLWLKLTLPAGSAAYKGASDLRVSGSTT